MYDRGRVAYIPLTSYTLPLSPSLLTKNTNGLEHPQSDDGSQGRVTVEVRLPPSWEETRPALFAPIFRLGVSSTFFRLTFSRALSRADQARWRLGLAGIDVLVHHLDKGILTRGFFEVEGRGLVR